MCVLKVSVVSCRQYIVVLFHQTIWPLCAFWLYNLIHLYLKKLCGRVEGHVLTPSCKSTRITADCWTIIYRKTLEITKKDTLQPKTKERPQWDGRRGTITIKSNPITTGWVTHKLENNYTTAVHPLEWRFWTPCQASQPGGPAIGGGFPRESDFEG